MEYNYKKMALERRTTMGKRVISGGIIEKNNKFLLVKETQEICRGKWGLPSGAVDDNEDVIEAAKREIFEETGCTVKVKGLLEIINKNIENKDMICFFFDTELITENIVVNGEEISNIRWFSYEEMLEIKEELRADGVWLSSIKNKIDGKIYPLDLININD